jgi:hypothetical protein
MIDKLKAELKSKYTGQLTSKFIDSLAERLSEKVEKEEDIQGVLSELEKSPIKISDLQAEGDRRATEVGAKLQELRSEMEKLKKAPKEPEHEKDDEDPLKELREKLNEIERRDRVREVKSKLTERAKEKKIPRFLIDTADIDDESKIDEVIEGLESKAKELKQQMISEGLVTEPPKRPSSGGGDDEEIVSTIKSNPVKKSNH